LPLRLGEGVIGTMDVTSTRSAAFTDQDAIVLQSLADQVAVAIENTRLYARTRELVVVEERNRLARDLHDSVTQSLSSLGILVEGWRRLAKDGEPYRIEVFLDRVSQITDQALKEMRLMVYELRPSALASAGLLGALHGRLEMVERRFGIDARVIADEIVDLPAPVEEELYWIAHEALSNSLKHSGATRVTIRIRCETGCLILEVSDNGRGFDISKVAAGGSVGLNNMVERARHLGGELQILTTPGEGVTIRAIVPLETISLAEQGLSPAEERRLA
jgi:signal transduction histidine kinase